MLHEKYKVRNNMFTHECPLFKGRHIEMSIQILLTVHAATQTQYCMPMAMSPYAIVCYYRALPYLGSDVITIMLIYFLLTCRLSIIFGCAA